MSQQNSDQTLQLFGRAPEIDITELETLFSVASATDSINKAGGRRGSKINKPEKVQLVSKFLAELLKIFKICHYQYQ